MGSSAITGSIVAASDKIPLVVMDGKRRSRREATFIG